MVAQRVHSSIYIPLDSSYICASFSNECRMYIEWGSDAERMAWYIFVDHMNIVHHIEPRRQKALGTNLTDLNL